MIATSVPARSACQGKRSSSTRQGAGPRRNIGRRHQAQAGPGGRSAAATAPTGNAIRVRPGDRRPTAAAAAPKRKNACPGHVSAAGGRSLRRLAVEDGDIERRQEDQRQQRRHHQPAHDGEGHRPPEHRGRDRDQAEHGRDRGQHHRPQARGRGGDHRIPDVLALGAVGLDLDDQDDGVLRDHAEQRQDAEDGDEAERPVEHQQRQHDADDAERQQRQHQPEPAEGLAAGTSAASA